MPPPPVIEPREAVPIMGKDGLPGGAGAGEPVPPLLGDCHVGGGQPQPGCKGREQEQPED